LKTNAIYFYTASILDWKCILNDETRQNIILGAIQHLTELNALKVYAFVIMPNHIHLIWQPLSNEKVKNVQLSFMKFTAQKILFELQDSEYPQIQDFLVDKKDRKYQIWHRNPLAVELYSRKVIEQKLDYIHNNPIEYVYSLASFYENDDPKYSFLTHYRDDI
jgi:putative transposase